MAEYQPYATKGVAGTALGLGIGAVGLNLLGSLLNAGRGLEVGGDLVVKPLALQQSERIAKLETELAFERSGRYTDLKAEVLEKQIFGLQLEIDHMKAVYVPGKLVMPESSVVSLPTATAA